MRKNRREDHFHALARSHINKCTQGRARAHTNTHAHRHTHAVTAIQIYRPSCIMFPACKSLSCYSALAFGRLLIEIYMIKLIINFTIFLLTCLLVCLGGFLQLQHLIRSDPRVPQRLGSCSLSTV